MVNARHLRSQVYYDAAQEFANQNGLFFYEAEMGEMGWLQRAFLLLAKNIAG